MLRRLLPLIVLALLVLGSAATTGEPRWPTVETADDLARSYVLLVLRIDQHRPGFNDAYCGPAAWRERVKSEDFVPLSELQATATRLREASAKIEADPDRLGWLRAQCGALEGYLRELQGEALPFTKRQRRLHGLRIESPDASRIRAAWREIDALEEKPETVAEQFETWWDRYQVKGADLRRAFELALDHSRRVSAARVPVPENEEVEVALVGSKPWWAYTWFLGRGRSRIDVSRDREYHAAFVLHMAAHEGYPGHHAELARRELRLVRGEKRLEWVVLPYFTPQACMMEATAEEAARLVFEDPRTRAWLRDVFLPALGHEGIDIDAWLASFRRLMRIRSVVEQETLWLWCEPDRRWLPDEKLAETLGGGSVVRNRLLGHAALRSFGPCYTVGRDLVRRYLDLGDPWKRFAKLTTAPLHPDLLERWIREERTAAAPGRESGGKTR